MLFRRRSSHNDQIGAVPSVEENATVSDTAPAEGTVGGYVTDAPVGRPTEDRFSRAPFAERIARTILAQHDPASIVIGVYGPWGEGKTSVLNLIEHALAEDERTVPIRFNPWRLGGETEMFVGFFETLADAIDAKLTTGRERAGMLLKNYGALLKPIPFAGDTAAGAASAVGGALSETNLSKSRLRIEQLLAESGRRVVILIDDIDRLDKTEIQAIFRLVKVAADFKHTAYVLAFDAAVVADALAERYAAGTRHGDNFMEKIVQLPLHLPPVAPEALLQITLETVAMALEQAGIELSESDVSEFRATFDRAVLPRIGTPRMGKRYANAVLFALPMIGDEVRPIDLLLIEAVRVFYPRLYEWIRTHEDVVLNGHHGAQSQAEAVRAVLREALADGTRGMTPAESQGAQLLLTTLFPRTESAWQNRTWPAEWDTTWAKSRRIASSQYFRRYFTYTVPSGDVRDSDIDALLHVLDSPDRDGGEAADLVAALLEAGGPDTFLSKVSGREDALSSLSSARLILLLAMFSDRFSTQSGFLALSTMERAALLVSKLLCRVDPEERLEVVSSVMGSAVSIPFAVEVLRWSRPGDDKHESALSLEQTTEAAEALVARIAPIWETGDPFATLGRAASRTLLVWRLYGDRDRLKVCLGARISQDLNFGLALLRALVGQAWSMETGVPHTPAFGRDAYDALVQYLDVADLFERLKQRFGDAVGDGAYYGFEDLAPEERLANEFGFIHRAVLAEVAKSQGESELGTE